MFTPYEKEINIIKSKKQNYEVLKRVDIDKFLKELYEKAINRIKSEKPHYKVLKGIDIDKFFKELEDSFIILEKMPFLYQKNYDLLRYKILYLNSPNLDRIRLEKFFINFIAFKRYIDEFASLIKDEKYQDIKDIIREQTKMKFVIAFVGALVFLGGLSAAIFLFPLLSSGALVVILQLTGIFPGLAGLKLFMINEYEQALTNDVKNLTSSVKNTSSLFAPKDNDLVSGAITNSML